MPGVIKTALKGGLRLLGNTRLNRARLGRQLAACDRLNIGCGESGVPGWVNIGLFSDRKVPYGTIVNHRATRLLHYDMTRGIPMRDETARYIYASHFIEHLTLGEARLFFRECYRVLKPGGMIRITTPDLELWIERYLANDLSFFERFYRCCPSYSDLTTKGQILVGQIQGWGHRWLYDLESLQAIMAEAGFGTITRMEHHQSALPDIQLLEPTDEERLLETFYVEAQKL